MKPDRWCVFFPKILISNWILLLFLGIMTPGGLCQDSEKTFVGSEACGQCHEQQYLSFTKYAKKNHSFSSVLKLKRGLTDKELKECYTCHTTGYGRAGGFVSEKETPHLKNAGCEVCHGPGSVHAETEDPEDIVSSLSVENCETCHNAQRIGAFKYKPLLYGGAH